MVWKGGNCISTARRCRIGAEASRFSWLEVSRISSAAWLEVLRLPSSQSSRWALTSTSNRYAERTLKIPRRSQCHDHISSVINSAQPNIQNHLLSMPKKNWSVTSLRHLRLVLSNSSYTSVGGAGFFAHTGLRSQSLGSELCSPHLLRLNHWIQSFISLDTLSIRSSDRAFVFWSVLN